MSGRFHILKDIVGYSGSAVVAQAVSLAAGFAVARMLGPADFGIWNAVSLVLVYGAYVDFGILSAMGRDLPFHYGQGDVEQADAVEGSARQATLGGAILAAVAVLALSFWPGQSPLMALGLQAMAVVLVLQQVYTYHRTVLRSNNQFGELSRQQVLFSVLSAGLAVAFVAIVGLVGRMLAAILAQAAIMLYALRRHPWRPMPKFKLPVAWSLVRVGIPITLSGFVLALLTTIDRLMVITFLGEKQLGYLGLALLLTSFVTLIPGMASQVLYPRITFQFGSSGKSVEALRSFVLTPPAILSLLLPLIIGPLVLILPLVITIFLPAYVPGITATRIVVIGIFFYSILGLTDYLLVTIGKLKQYVLFGCMALGVDLLLDYLFLRSGYGIEGVALGGTLLTYFFYSCMIIGYALSHYTRRFGDWIRFFSRLWFPFFYMLGLLWAVEKAASALLPATSAADSVVAVGVQIFLYLIGCLPLIYLASRELKLDFSKAGLARFIAR
jgi:O-antigen/teichoic acid export membrane protein